MLQFFSAKMSATNVMSIQAKKLLGHFSQHKSNEKNHSSGMTKNNLKFQEIKKKRFVPWSRPAPGTNNLFPFLMILLYTNLLQSVVTIWHTLLTNKSKVKTNENELCLAKKIKCRFRAMCMCIKYKCLYAIFTDSAVLVWPGQDSAKYQI